MGAWTNPITPKRNIGLPILYSRVGKTSLAPKASLDSSEGSEVSGERVRKRRVAGSTRDEAKTSKRSFPPELPLDATSARELIADGPLHRVDAVPLVQRPGRKLPGGEPRVVPARPCCSGSGSFPTNIPVFRIPVYMYQNIPIRNFQLQVFFSCQRQV